MKKFLLLLLFHGSIITITCGQSFTVHDLVSLSSLPPAEISHFMNKNGYVLNTNSEGGDSITDYIQKLKNRKAVRDSLKSVDLYERNNSKYFVLHTSSLSECLDGRQSLIRSKFMHSARKDITKDSSILFQKANVTVISEWETRDSATFYTFTLRVKKVPDSILYAEELLQFDSHEFLVSYFGEKNVSSDLYYFSEKELRKCSVLFSGTQYQAVFVWGDEENLNNLSYIQLSNILPTKKAKEMGMIDGTNNNWKFRSGIHWGMPVKDILRLNEMDFYLYGDKSELAFMVKPEVTGKINFKKTGIIFSCDNCADNQIFNQDEVSALDVAKAHLPLNIFGIIIYP